VHCRSDAGQALFSEALNLPREHARFALRTNEDKAIVPHGNAMRIQVGGLRGIRRLLAPDANDPLAVPDVVRILEAAQESYGDLDVGSLFRSDAQHCRLSGRDSRAPPS
jgi:hypothetical protein